MQGFVLGELGSGGGLAVACAGVAGVQPAAHRSQPRPAGQLGYVDNKAPALVGEILEVHIAVHD
ncbi:MAG: hypothetical protein DRQ48_00090 [Gammaproteobacteria bacterium]|nr:MAG: hypothetical protein DRQ48_00090 [Gammaproteobacteria bacterium]